MKNCNTCSKSGHDDFLGDVYMCDKGERLQYFTPYPKVIGIDFDCPYWEEIKC